MKNSLSNTASLFWNKGIGTKVSRSAALGVSVPSVLSGGGRTRYNNCLPSATTVASIAASPWSVGEDWTRGIQRFSSSSSSNSSSDTAAVSDRGGAILQGPSSVLHLPPADAPVGLQLYQKAIYCPASRTLRTSAHVGTTDDNGKADGIVGDTVTPEEARTHARNSGLRLLATIHHALEGDLGRVEQVLHLRGMVKATPDFSGQAGVIDGCSEVLVEAFGPSVGIGTRECFGVGSLGATVVCTLELRVSPPK